MDERTCNELVSILSIEKGENIMKRILTLLGLLIVTLLGASQIAKAKELSAKSVPSSFYVDYDQSVALNLVEAYEIGGKKYFSLEDVAYALKDTNSKVTTSIKGNTATVTLGKSQKKTSTVLHAATGKSYKVSAATVILDGAKREETAYLIEHKICMTMEDIAVVYDVLLANGGINRMKLYAGIQNTENVPLSEKGQITSDWEEGMYGIQLTYAPEFMATVSYGRIDYGASIVCGKYSENPETKQLFVLRKSRTWNGYQLYTFENMNSYMFMTANIAGKSDNIWQSDMQNFVYEFILEPGNGGGTLINVDKATKTYIGIWNNDKKIGAGFNSSGTATSFNLIRY